MKNSENKKGVVIINSPKVLMDFLCFYCESGYQYSWTVICDIDKRMNEACHRSGIFDQLYNFEHDYRKIGLKAQAALFLRMFLRAVIGNQKHICKEIIAQSVPVSIDEFDVVVMRHDFILTEGAFLQITDEVNVVILEDGRMDYIERKWGNIWKSKFSFYQIQGFILAFLGYANTAYQYPLRTTKNADKYASYPEELIYRKYKSIHKLDFKNEVYKDRLNGLINKTFLIPEDESLFQGDVLIFTAHFELFTEDETEVFDKTISYINKTYKGKKIILKKHPLDKNEYVFDSSIEASEIDKQIPGELLAAKIEVKECIYMFPSTLMDEFMNVIENYKILYYECLNKGKNVKIAYDQAFQSALTNVPLDKERIVYI